RVVHDSSPDRRRLAAPLKRPLWVWRPAGDPADRFPQRSSVRLAVVVGVRSARGPLRLVTRRSKPAPVLRVVRVRANAGRTRGPWRPIVADSTTLDGCSRPSNRAYPRDFCGAALGTISSLRGL